MTSVSTRDLALALGLAAVLAGGLWAAWGWLALPTGVFTPGLAGHGPAPLAWPRLLVGWIPATHGAFAVAYWLLARGGSGVTLRRHFLIDQALVLLALPIVGALHLAGAAGPWRPALAVGYATLVGTKTAVFQHALWRWLSGQRALGVRAVAAVGLGAVLPYACLGGSVVTAVSAVGDEPYYLLIAHSLIHDGDTAVMDNIARQEYRPFYWGRLGTDQAPYYLGAMEDSLSQYRGLQPLLLLPGYWLGGRTGAVLTMALVSAGGLAVAFRMALTLGGELRAAYLAWLGAAFAAPTLSFATSPFPEMSAGLLLVTAGSLVLGGGLRPTAVALAAALFGAVVALKPRFLLMAVPLLVGLVPRLTPRRLVLLGVGLAGLAGATAAYDTLFTGGLAGRYLARGGPLGMDTWSWQTLLGYLFDQEYGLVASAPAFAVAFAGALVAARDGRYRVLLVTAGPFAATWLFFGLGLGVTYGGTAPPARYLTGSLPLLVPLAALAYARLRGRLLWALAIALLAAGVLHAIVLSLWPAWRFQRGVGRSAVLYGLWELTGLDTGRLLPSFLAPHAGWASLAVVGLLILGVVGWWLGGRPGQDPPRGAAAVGVLTVVLTVSVGVGVTWWRPWGTFPAAAWEGRGGMVFRGAIAVDPGTGTPALTQKLVWAVQRPAVVTIAPWLPAGRYRLVVRAGGTGLPAGPILRVRAGESLAEEVTLAGAPPPGWRSGDYAFDLRWGGGRLPVRLEIHDVSREPVRLAYLEHVRLDRRGR